MSGIISKTCSFMLVASLRVCSPRIRSFTLFVSQQHQKPQQCWVSHRSKHPYSTKTDATPSIPSIRSTRVFFTRDLIVSPDESGMRVDRFLQMRLNKDRLRQQNKDMSVNFVLIQKLFRKRQVKLLTSGSMIVRKGPQSVPPEGHESTNPVSPSKVVTSASTRTETGQVWRIRVQEPIADDQTPIEEEGKKDGKELQWERSKDAGYLPLKDWIVYKDERIVVLNKPPGIAVQGGTGVEDSIDSSLSELQFDYPDRPRIVHRLDKTTSGLLVLARTRKAAQDLSKRFHDGSSLSASVDAIEGDCCGIQKKYIAIVHSKEPLNIPNDHDSLTRLSAHMGLAAKGNKSDSIEIVSNSNARSISKTWSSITDVRVVSQSVHAGDYWALVHLYPRTGRKHQLRVHCAQLLNAPILGDEKYAQALFGMGGNISSRIHLHMSELTLEKWNATKKGQMPSQQGEDNGTHQKREKDTSSSLHIRATLPAETEAEMIRLGLQT